MFFCKNSHNTFCFKHDVIVGSDLEYLSWKALVSNHNIAPIKQKKVEIDVNVDYAKFNPYGHNYVVFAGDTRSYTLIFLSQRFRHNQNGALAEVTVIPKGTSSHKNPSIKLTEDVRCERLIGSNYWSKEYSFK
ncbi:MAG: hypothetical protein KA715_10160 [Xanthomonadaceae bacterium]|nr:hypothetical protein [Xanthomonadaceae bacterium]